MASESPESALPEASALDADRVTIQPDDPRLAALAEFAAGAGHEINNPLATIIGRAQLLLPGETAADRRQSLQTIIAQALRVRDMIGDVMLFARPPQPQRSDFDAAELVRDVLRGLADWLEGRGVTCEFVATGEVPLRADQRQFGVVASELIRNAAEASAAGDVLQVDLTHHAGTVTFQVTDHGRGLTEIERQHLFDPFFSGRTAGRGLGFGLPKCWQILRQHGGELTVQTGPASAFAVSTVARAIWPRQTPAQSADKPN